MAGAKPVRRTKSLMYPPTGSRRCPDFTERSGIITGAYLYITINPHSAIDRDIADSRDDRADILSSITPSPIRLNIESSLAISDRVSNV